MKLPFQATPRQQQATLLIVLAVVSVGAFHRFYVAGVEARIAEQEKTLMGLNVRIQGYGEASDRRQQLDEHVRGLELRLDALGRVLPEHKDQAALLTDLHALALASGVVVRGFKPLPIEDKPQYRQWPLTLELDASYHTLGQFFEDISKLSRLVTIDSLSITANERKSGREPTIRVTCVASTFVLGPAESKTTEKATE